MDQSIAREMWVKWDGTLVQGPAAQPVQPASAPSSQNINYDSDSTVEYDLESYMDYEDNISNNNRSNIPNDMNKLIRQVTPVAWLDNPQHVVTNNYTPASPVYNPDTPIEIDSDEEGPSRASMSPAQLELPIVTPASEIFDSDNSDSHLEFEGELEAKNILKEFCNTGKLPTRMHGVFLYPQKHQVHGQSWNEYPDEPCSSHCMIPARADKNFAKFDLTHRLCQKHNSTLTGPWLYLSNRISTLHKVYKCPEICHFITLLYQKMKPNHEIRDVLIASQLVENQHAYTLIIRMDVYLINDPFNLKSWYQSYNLDDMFSFANKIHYYVQRDFVDRVHEAYLEGQP